MRQRQKEPIKFLWLHRDQVIETIEKSRGKLRVAWEVLKETLPGIEDEMAYDTFKVHQKSIFFFQVILQAEVDQELKRLGKTVREPETPINTGIPGKVRESVRQRPKREPEQVPGNFQGWGIQFKKPYYRLFKKIDGRTRWLQVGRTWDETTAADKIRAFTG